MAFYKEWVGTLYYPHHPITTFLSMEYPGSFLTKPWRHLILALFITIFFAVSPLVLLYTSGYRIDIGFGLVHQVGIVSIEGIPRIASVSINGLTQSSNLPAKLNAVLPGTYRLTLRAPDYHSWEQTIIVHAKETTYIKDIDLPRNVPPERFSLTIPEKFVALRDKEALLYTEKSPQGTSLIYQPLNSSLPLFITSTSQAIEKLVVSPHEEFVAVQPISSPPFFIEIKSLRIFPSHASSSLFHWDAEGPDDQIYQESNNTIHRIDILAGTETDYAKKKTSFDWFPYDDTLWNLTTSDFNSSSLSIQNFLPSFISNQQTEWNKALRSWNEGTSWSFLDIRDGLAFLKKDLEDEVSVVTHKKISSLPVNSLLADQRKKDFLLRGPFEIWHVTKDTEPAFIYRSSEPLVTADFLNKTDLYLIATKHHLFSYQDTYGITTELADIVTVDEAYAFPTSRIIIFSGTYQGIEGIWKLIY